MEIRRESLKSFVRVSTAISAIFCFAALNGALGAAYSMSKVVSVDDPGIRPNQLIRCMRRTISHLNNKDEVSIESAVKGFQGMSPPANVVLMGSSLMMFPVWEVDKDAEPNLIADKFEYHRSMVLQKKLRLDGLSNAIVYNMATPLQMISDSYMFMDKLFVGNKTPNTVVLGISPRDFWDSEFSSPGSTLNFVDQVGLCEYPRYCAQYLPEWHDKFEFVLGQSLILYDKRSFIQRFFRERLSGKERTPMMAAGTQFAFGLGRYKVRYQGISMGAIAKQSEFLNRIAELCERRNIKLILVNMPLPGVNRELFPPLFYHQYQDELLAFSRAKRVQVIDLSDLPEFKLDYDYSDSAHMNKYGGKQLIEHIVPPIVANPHPAVRYM